MHIRWFEGGKLNVSYNCLDRHLDTRGDQVAIIWEGDNPKEDRKLTYRDLYEEVCKLANVIKSRGVKKGDRVCIYMPMIPEAGGDARLRAHRRGALRRLWRLLAGSVCATASTTPNAKLLITADESVRGGARFR